MLRGESVTRDLLAELIRGAVDETVKKQLQRRTQEPSISSKITESVESRLNGRVINGYSIYVVAQDFADRGRGSWEHKSGADLYIGIRVESPYEPTVIAKGLLIQAKKARPIRLSDDRLIGERTTASKEHQNLVDQCEKMLARSRKGSFVWVYSAGGTHVVPATEVVSKQVVPPEYLQGRNVAEQFRDVLDCFSGDEKLVSLDVFDDDEALGVYLDEIAVARGLAITVARAE